MFIDTSDKMDVNQYVVCSIFAKLDVIEYKTNKMAHEIDTINPILELWNNKKIKDSYFLNFLNQYIDENL